MLCTLCFNMNIAKLKEEVGKSKEGVTEKRGRVQIYGGADRKKKLKKKKKKLFATVPNPSS